MKTPIRPAPIDPDHIQLEDALAAYLAEAPTPYHDLQVEFESVEHALSAFVGQVRK